MNIVIVGLGMSGACAALAAVEGGAKVAVLQKVGIPMTHGNFCAVINCDELTEAGCQTMDVDAVMKTFNENNSNAINWNLVKRYFEESPESGSWLLNRAEEAGAEAIIPAPVPAVKFKGKQVAGVTALAELAQSKGVEIFYATSGKQLVRDDGGRVTGGIGETDTGKHILAIHSGNNY